MDNYIKIPSSFSNKQRDKETLNALKTTFYILSFLDKDGTVRTKVGITANIYSRMINYRIKKSDRQKKLDIYATIECPDRPTAKRLEKKICKSFTPIEGKEYLYDHPKEVLEKTASIIHLFDIGGDKITSFVRQDGK